MTEQRRNAIAAFDDNDGNKIGYGIFQWGPCVFQSRISKELHEALLSEAEASRKKELHWEQKLAGIIKEEYALRDKNMFVEPLGQWLSLYHHAFKKWRNQPELMSPKYQLRDLWVNFQKPGEFNPPHDHGGALSFVIYLRVPDEIKKEFEAYRGTSSGPGGITFLYGDGDQQAITLQRVFPAERDIIIFPAWVKHYVAPFKADVTRISVAGNILDRTWIGETPEGSRI